MVSCPLREAYNVTYDTYAALLIMVRTVDELSADEGWSAKRDLGRGQWRKKRNDRAQGDGDDTVALRRLEAPAAAAQASATYYTTGP